RKPLRYFVWLYLYLLWSAKEYRPTNAPYQRKSKLFEFLLPICIAYVMQRTGNCQPPKPQERSGYSVWQHPPGNGSNHAEQLNWNLRCRYFHKALLRHQSFLRKHYLNAIQQSTFGQDTNVPVYHVGCYISLACSCLPQLCL